MTKGIRYYSVEEVQQTSWLIQGSTYDTREQAGYAALTLLCTVTGVLVKRCSGGGFALLYWLRDNLAA